MNNINILIVCEESQAVCKAFPGIANAMARQWGKYLIEKHLEELL